MISGLVLHCDDDINPIGYCWIYLLHLDPQITDVKEQKGSPRLKTLGMQQFIPCPFHFDQQSSNHNPLCMKQKRHLSVPCGPLSLKRQMRHIQVKNWL